MPELTSLIIVAAEEIPADTFMAKIITPLALLVFLGSTYLLLRSNLGTRRGYYVMATSTFGFLFIMSLFWAFGAPGTPQATGPTHLPGQQLDALLPKWIPFAQDSLLADREELSAVKQFPEGFADPPAEAEDDVETAVDDIQGFFSSDAAGNQIGDDWAVVDVGYRDEPQLVGATFQEVDEETLQPDPEGDTYTAFAFFDDGNPLLPSYIFIVVSLLLFLLHAFLLDRDETRERRAIAATAPPAREAERVPAEA